MIDAVVHGFGVVGRATAYALGIDRYNDLTGGNVTVEESAKYRYQFVCIPTPFVSGGYYTGGIIDLIKQINGDNVFIIRSTVLPGTCHEIAEITGKMAVVHMPEFLTESTAFRDSVYPDQIIVGCDDTEIRSEVIALVRGRYFHFRPDDRVPPIIGVGVVTAELIKCATNAFYSMKVIFANEVFELAQRVGADYDDVKDALYRHKWIGENHLDVNFKRPSWDAPRRGLHGKCLPKDLKALTSFSGSKLLKVVEELNEGLVKEGE